MAPIRSRHMSQNTLPAADSQILSEVRDLSFMIRLMAAVMAGVAALFSYAIVSTFPLFVGLFADMYGDPRLLPKLTYLVLSWAHLGDGWVVIALVVLLAGAGIVLPWFIRSGKLALVISLGSGVLLMLHGFLGCAAMLAGLVRVLKSLGEAI